MIKNEIKQFMEHIKRLKDKEYFLSIVQYYLAPTIQGYKPSTLLTFSKQNRNLYRLWKEYNKELFNTLSLEYMEIQDDGEKILILFYNNQSIEELLKDSELICFLMKFGYCGIKGSRAYLLRLKERFQQKLPHEIGVFLGIPLEDVKEYIKNRGQNSICCGYWKVYQHPEQAKKIFKAYDDAKLEKVMEMSKNNG